MVVRDVSRRVDPTAVEDYFAFGYVPDPKTIFVDVHKLEPGHLMVDQARIDGSRAAALLGRAVVWAGDRDQLGDGCTPMAVASALKEAVERRLVADVPLGAFLPAESIRARSSR